MLWKRSPASIIKRLIATFGRTRHPLEDRLYGKISRRIVPFMMLLYLVSFLDRVNVGFAALTMNADLSFSPIVFGWGAGIFFFGYVLFEVPSNVILEKVGARIWICRIMVTWGIISTAMALTQGPASFYVLRFLLGVAEAGFFPGMILYLTYWYPSERRARIIALFMTAVPLASAIGAPISGFILAATHDLLGLRGWQWLFVIEGLPACLLGLLVLRFLPDGPTKADWLTEEEKAHVVQRLARERTSTPHHVHEALWPALRDPRILLLNLIYLGFAVGLYGIGLWLPQIIAGMGFSTVQTGLLVALPYAISPIAMLYWGRRSDRTGERIRHVAAPALVGVAAFAASAVLESNALVLCGLALAALSLYSMVGPFWAIPPVFLGGAAAAGGIALINSVGNLGGFIGPYLIGLLKQNTGGYAAGMSFLAICLAGSAILILVLGRVLRTAPAPISRPHPS